MTAAIISSRHKSALAVVLALVATFATFPAAAAAEIDIFSASCLPSHVANDDPIVFPGLPGAAHAHEFSGAFSTDAFSTAKSLTESGTTCDPAGDTAAYWTPVLYVKGQRAEINHTTAYYAPGRKDNATIKAWPQGFKMIADIKNNTYAISGYEHAGWSCGSEQVKWGYQSSLEDIKYHCPYGLQVRVIFPECWDGKNLDTVNPDGTPAKNPVTGNTYPNNHRSHVVYVPPPPAPGVCPASHPVATPRIDLKINFETQGLVDSKENRPANFTSESKIQSDTPYDAPEPNEGDRSSDFTVAGGDMNSAINNNYDVNTFHADFYNAWRQADLEYLIDYCIKQRKGAGEHAAVPEPRSQPRRRAEPELPVRDAARRVDAGTAARYDDHREPRQPGRQHRPEHVQVRVKPTRGDLRLQARLRELHELYIAEDLQQSDAWRAHV